MLFRAVSLISIITTQSKNRHMCEFLPQQRVKLTPVFSEALQGLAWQRRRLGFTLQTHIWRHQSDVKRGRSGLGARNLVSGHDSLVTLGKVLPQTEGTQCLRGEELTPGPAPEASPPDCANAKEGHTTPSPRGGAEADALSIAFARPIRNDVPPAQSTGGPNQRRERGSRLS